jgi:adenosylcobinamide-GDP ribazoletransferase
MNDPLSHPFVEDLTACLRFYSRLNLPAAPNGAVMADFGKALRALPVAGAIIGGAGGAALFCARAVGLPILPAAICAVAALVAVTGALHEDGLADVADGFGGGATREKKLEIMRDSRLGSYGAIALALALMLRVASLAALTERGLGLAISALICAGAVSRTAGLLPLLLSAPARRDGAGAAMPRPAGDATRLALILAGAASVPLLFAGLSVSQVLCAGIAAALAAFVVTRLAERQIGGYTGDVLGATQQAAEIAVLLALSAR